MAENGVNIGKAYVQIIPSAEGIGSAVQNVLDDELPQVGDSGGKSLGTSMVSALKTVIVSAGIGAAFKESLEAGGALQQSIGGVETLFKDSADTVKQYAEQAYKTAGMSANEYMETATSFAASLVSSLSGDTETAAEIANVAMTDMSDNANKMGTSMTDIQNAYQGFAKQNYTMLDNLKLGYGGTQTEMKRLIADANELRAAQGLNADLTIDSFSDIVVAIHTIQDELDITGTTGKEAATTLTGSMSAMSAAFQNVLADLALGESITEPLKELVSTASVFLIDNAMPMVGNVLAGVPEVIASALPELLSAATGLVTDVATGITETLPDTLAAIPVAITSFCAQMLSDASAFLESGEMLLESLAAGIVQSLPVLADTVVMLIDTIGQFICDNAASLVESAGTIVTTLYDGLAANLPFIVESGADIIGNLVTGVFNALPEVAVAAAGVIQQIVISIVESLPQLVAAGGQLLDAIAQGISETIPNAVYQMGRMVGLLLEKVKSIDWGALGSDIIRFMGNGIKGMGTSLVNAVKTAFTNALNWITSLPSKAVQWGKNLISNFIKGMKGESGGSDSASALVALEEETNALADAYQWSDSTIAESAEDMSNAVINAYQGAGNAAESAAAKTASSAAKTASATKAAATVINSYSDTTKSVLDGVTTTVQTTLSEMSDGTTQTSKVITEKFEQVVDGVAKSVTKTTTVAANGTKTIKQTMEDVAATVVDTTTVTVDGIKTITKTLSDGTQEQQQVISESNEGILNGMLVTVEKAKTIAADGSVSVTQTIKEATAATWDGLTGEWQDKAEESALGTFSTLYTAVKNQSWTDVGEWVVSTLYNAMDNENKLRLKRFGDTLIDGFNSTLNDVFKQLGNGAFDLGQSIFSGVTQGMSQAAPVLAQLGADISGAFTSLAPVLASASATMGTAMSGGLIAAVPSIMASMGSIVAAVGGAFAGLLESIAAALSASIVGIPMGVIVAGAGVALVAAIAAICAGLGYSFNKGSNTSSSSSSSSSSGLIFDVGDILWQQEKQAALPEKSQKKNIEVNQYIYSKTQTAADLMREARHEQERAVLMGV